MTRANDARPTRREVDGGEDGILIVEIGEKTLTIRPKGRRNGRVWYNWGAVYRKLLWADAQFRLQEAKKKNSKGPKQVKRGLL